MECCPICRRPLERDKKFTVDLASNCVVVDGRQVRLTGKQAEVLQVLYDAMPRVVPVPALMAAIYPHEEPHPRIIACFVMQLRQRLEKTRVRVITHWGSGFQLAFDAVQGATPVITYPTGWRRRLGVR